VRFLLDTDTCIHALKQHEDVLRRLLAHRRSEVALSVVTEAELRTGAAKSAAPTRSALLVERFLHPLAILDFTSLDAIVYARLRAKLERAGTSIGPLDMLIAAQAVARRLVLVSSNAREFRRVPGLRLESWAAS
jgi:tRNA(fMet)-specific endonuclease VapC